MQHSFSIQVLTVVIFMIRNRLPTSFTASYFNLSKLNPEIGCFYFTPVNLSSCLLSYLCFVSCSLCVHVSVHQAVHWYYAVSTMQCEPYTKHKAVSTIQCPLCRLFHAVPCNICPLPTIVDCLDYLRPALYSLLSHWPLFPVLVFLHPPCSTLLGAMPAPTLGVLRHRVPLRARVGGLSTLDQAGYLPA